MADRIPSRRRKQNVEPLQAIVVCIVVVYAAVLGGTLGGVFDPRLPGIRQQGQPQPHVDPFAKGNDPNVDPGEKKKGPELIPDEPPPFPKQDPEREKQLAEERDKRLQVLKSQEEKFLETFSPNDSVPGGSSILPHVFSPDGKLIAVAFTPDGKGIVNDPTHLKVWDWLAGRQLHVFPFHANDNWAICFSEDGKRLMAAGVEDKKTLKISSWGLDSGKLERTIAAPVNRRIWNLLVFSPDGKYLAADFHGTFGIFDVQTGKELAFREDWANGIRLFSPNGILLATTSFGGRQISLWETKTWKKVATKELANLEGAVFSPDGWTLALGGKLKKDGNAVVVLWDLANNEERIIPAKNTGPFVPMVFSPDGKSMVWQKNWDQQYFADLTGDKAPVAMDDLARWPCLFSPGGVFLTAAVRDRTILYPVVELPKRPKPNVGDWAEVKVKGNGLVVNAKSDKVTDEHLASLKKFAPIVELTLGFSDKITDGGIAQLKGLGELEKLDLHFCRNISEAGLLASLEGLKNLKQLNVSGLEKLTDAGLAHLAKLSNLEKLELRFNKLKGPGLVHLKSLAKLRSLDLLGLKLEGSQLAPLATLSNLTHLTLAENESGDALAPLANLSNLTVLDLRDNTVSDAGLTHLKNLKKLQTLVLQENHKITGAGFVHLKDHLDMKALHAWGCRSLGDVGLEHLQNLLQLATLTLENTAITDAGLAHLARLKHLALVNVSGAKGIKGPGLANFKDMPGFKKLNLIGTSVDDAGLAGVKDLVQLEELYVPPNITEAGLIHLAQLKNLKEFNHRDISNLKGSGLKYLKDAKGLTYLWLDKTDVDDAGLEGIKNSIHVEQVSLPSRITDAGLAHLSGMKGLKTLSGELPNVKGPGLQHLRGLKNLRTLFLGKSGLTDEGLAHLAGLDQVERLGLPARITDVGLAQLKTLKNLTSLTFEGSKITNAALDLLGTFPKLNRLEIRATRVTPAAIEAFKKTKKDVYVTYEPPAPLADVREWASVENRNNKLAVFAFSDKVTDDNLAALSGQDATDLDKIEDLVLSGAKNISDAGLVALKSLKNLRTLNLSYSKVKGPGLVHLKALSGLNVLRLEKLDLDDAALASLAELSNLTQLDLRNNKLTDAALAHLKNMKKLRELVLDGNKAITGSQIEHLKDHVELETLILRQCKVADAVLVHLKGLAKLQSLDLSGTDITDAGLGHLAGMQKLRSLQIDGVKGVKGPGLQHLRNLKDITFLNLHGTGVDDAGLAGVKDLTHLNDLILPDGITDAGFVYLAKLTGLVELEFGQHKGFKGPGLAHLRDMKKLSYLNLRGTAIDDAGLAGIKDLKQLRGLSLPERLTDAGLAHLADLTELNGLDFDLPNVKGPGLAHLKKLTKMQQLLLDRTGITDEGLAHIGDFGHIKFLAVPKQVGDAGVAHLKGMKGLENLSLARSKVSDAALDHVRDIPNLRELNLSDTKVSAEAVERLKKDKPMLRVFRGG